MYLFSNGIEGYKKRTKKKKKEFFKVKKNNYKTGKILKRQNATGDFLIFRQVRGFLRILYGTQITNKLLDHQE